MLETSRVPRRSEPGSATSEVAERALDVLLCFLASDGDLGVTEIARRVGIDKSRVHRFLVALKRKGFVVGNPRTRRYSLGFRALELGRALTHQIDLEEQAGPFLSELRNHVGETAGLAVRVGGRRVHLAQAESAHEIRQTFPIGAPLPLHMGAGGKVLLAFASEDERGSLLATSVADGPPRPATVLAHFRAELPLVQDRGHATSLGERVPGSRSIAAPVWTWRGDVLALVISGPSGRFTEAVATGALPRLCDVAGRLTRQLGGLEYAVEHAREGVS